MTHPVKIDLNKKLDSKQKTIQPIIFSFSEPLGINIESLNSLLLRNQLFI